MNPIVFLDTNPFGLLPPEPPIPTFTPPELWEQHDWTIIDKHTHALMMAGSISMEGVLHRNKNLPKTSNVKPWPPFPRKPRHA